MKLHHLRHVTMLIDYAGKRFLIDPMFAPKGEYKPAAEREWPFCDLPLPPKDIVKNIDGVILTRLQKDSFDKFAQESIPKGTKIFVQDKYDKNALEKEKFSNIEVLSVDGTDFCGIKLYKIEGRHGEREFAEPVILAYGERWECMGVVFKTEIEPAFYLAGDTVFYAQVKNAIEEYKPKYVAVVPSCRQISTSGPLNMGYCDIKELYQSAKGTKIIGIGLDTVVGTHISREQLRKSDVKDNIYLPANGEIMFLE